MFKYYDYTSISHILKIFKIKNIIISGLNDKNIINEILKFDGNIITLNLKKIKNVKNINDKPLSALSKLNNYDAIFLDDCPNWYTLFNQLNIIKNTNDTFPLVFICNNKFPNKRRDAYLNPDEIPPEFKHEYTTHFPVHYHNKKITISDGLYHACISDSPKNGVLTAIEDFISENNHIGIMPFNFIEDITILYPKLQINQKRIEIIGKNIKSNEINEINFSDRLIENRLLISHIIKNNISNDNISELELEILKKNNIIQDYENKIRMIDDEVNYKNSQLSNIESEMSLKDSMLKNVESKLINKENEINILHNHLEELEKNKIHADNQLKLANEQIELLNQQIENEKNNLNINNMEHNNQITVANSQINLLKRNLSEKIKITAENEKNLKDQINNNVKELNEKNLKIKETENEIIFLKNQLKEFDNEINSLNEDLNKKIESYHKTELKLKNQIQQKLNEINKKESIIKQKNNQLNDKSEVINILEQRFTNQIAKNETKDYCISCFKDEINNNQTEIDYLKNHSFTKKILSPFSYIFLILKSNPKEIYLNYKLLKALSNSKCFDIGFYLNNNPDIKKSKWCKYFSPELHYVCNGFEEQRTFNKKYYNLNSKKELLDYLLICNE